ncbi:hypothetical protein EDC04DRAFT_2866242 [Pisolithus marmoratus]|nr:hypothetical protein EDC04DRAFT_2866242 [Pisolithus marmoratus]
MGWTVGKSADHLPYLGVQSAESVGKWDGLWESLQTTFHIWESSLQTAFHIWQAAGFLGGWIILQLLQRGEDPKRIRVLDIRLPSRVDLRTGRAQHATFLRPISDAFWAPWPEEGTNDEGITVFHSAATIRYCERIPALFSRSTDVNYEGTKNVIMASKDIGASILVYTSSTAIAVRRSRFWLWPWETRPQFFVQVINDDDSLIPKYHEHFCSNYAAPGGDIVCGSYLVRKFNPTWFKNILQSYVYVENCALAHLCHEQRLIKLEKGGANPDIGGQAFTITDTGPPCTVADVCLSLSTLDSACKFPNCSPTLMLSLAHVIEVLYVSKTLLSTDLIKLQPSPFAASNVHLIVDDTRARLSPSDGGLGYNGPCTTLQGICKTADAHCKAGEERSQTGGIDLHRKAWRMPKCLGKVQKSVEEQRVKSPITTLMGDAEAAGSVLSG